MGKKVTVSMGHPIISGYQYSHNDVAVVGGSGYALTSQFSFAPGQDILSKKDFAQADAVYEARYPSNYSVTPSSVGSFGFLSNTNTLTAAGYQATGAGSINPVLQASYQATGLNTNVAGTVVSVANPSGIVPIMKISNDQGPVLGLSEPALATGTGLYSVFQAVVTPVNASGNKGSMTYWNGSSAVTI